MSVLRRMRHAWYTSFAKTRKANRALRGRVEDQMVALWNRNQLIADQDQEITDLRATIKTLQQDVSSLRTQLEEAARLRDYWHGKAVNP